MVPSACNSIEANRRINALIFTGGTQNLSEPIYMQLYYYQ